MMKWNRIGLLIAVMAAGAVGYAPFSHAAEVAVAKPEGGDISAIIVAGDEAVLSSQMAGRILKMNVALGSTFAAGTVLVEFDCAERQAQLDAAKAENLGARETHLAKLRLQGLGAAGELEVTTAAAAAGRALAQVRMIESQMSYCKIVAPYSARVARLRAKAAETVGMGQPLLEIVSPGGLRATMNVPAAYMQWLRAGQAVELRSPDGGRTYNARVSRINSRVDGVSQTLEIEAAIDRASRELVPGMVLGAGFPQRPK